MPNLRDIKSRIKSIQNTQKITRAMKMVAGAKVKRVEGMVRSSRPFTKSITQLFKRIVSQAATTEATGTKIASPIENYPALLQVRELKAMGVLVITSDKGLAGAYNANVVRRTQAIIKENHDNGIQTKLFIVGNKGITALKTFITKKNYNAEIIHQYSKLPAIPTVGGAHVIIEDIATLYVDGVIDQFNIVSTKFLSMLSFQVQNAQILPALIETETEDSLVAAETLFEPDSESLLQMVVPMYLTNTVFQMLIESAASELAARMSAMSAATNNANEMTRKLTILYNKARQANITQELLEVVSGADALKG